MTSFVSQEASTRDPRQVSGQSPGSSTLSCFPHPGTLSPQPQSARRLVGQREPGTFWGPPEPLNPQSRWPVVSTLTFVPAQLHPLPAWSLLLQLANSQAVPAHTVLPLKPHINAQPHPHHADGDTKGWRSQQTSQGSKQVRGRSPESETRTMCSKAST